MADTLTIAALQLLNRPHQADARWEAIEAWTARAAAARAQFVVLPELACSGYVPNGSAWDQGEPVDGPSLSAVRVMAARHRVHMGVGVVLREGDDLVNAYALVDDAGQLVGIVRKRYPETYCFASGDGSVALETRWGRIGIAICADNHRLDTLQRLRAAGVRLHLMPHAWPMPTGAGGIVSDADLAVASERASGLCRTYAERLGVPVVLVNAVGPLQRMDGMLGALMAPGRFALGGLSQVATPEGERFGPLGDEEGMLLATVELGPSKAVAGDPPTWRGWLHPGQPLLRRVLMPIDAWWGGRVYRSRRSARRPARHDHA